MEGRKTRGQEAGLCNCGSEAPRQAASRHFGAAPRLRGQATGSRGSEVRGQATTEMLVLVGFALAFIIPLAFLFLSASNNESGKTALVQAKASARSIADSAGEVYLQGAGARKYIVVNYPQGVVDASAGDGVVVLTLDSNGRRQDVVATTFANLTGNLSGRRGAGLQTINLVNLDGNAVNVTYQK